MTVSDDDFIDSPRATIFRRELALFDRALDIDVLALLESDRHIRQITVEREAMPIRMLLPLLVAILITVGLPETDICYRGSRRQITDLRFLGKMPCYFDSIHLHDVIRTIRWPFRPGHDSTSARPSDGSRPH